MLRKILIFLLIAGGLGLIAYPSARVAYLEYQQKQLLAQWEKELAILNVTDEETGQTAAEGAGAETESAVTTVASGEAYKPQVEGLLEIEKIRLKIPIITGVNDRNLNLGVTSVEKTGRPGEIGNYCIAGHNSRSYGRQFNRLDELAPGDEIRVTAGDKVYVYQVTEKMLVQPEEVEVMWGNGKDRLITLITCDYSQEPYLRLIVRGELVEADIS